MAADDPREGYPPGQQRDWRPIPDPTSLTTEQLRRELSALREILTARLDGMDRATALLDETVNRTPTEIQTQIAHLKELLESRHENAEGMSLTRLSSLEQRFAEIDLRYEQRFSERDIRFREEFSGVNQRFAERDIRTDQAATAASEALKAALQAAKEAVFEQAQAAAKAAEKVEQSFTKQIDQIGLRIDTVAQGFDARLTELKERIDRGEGGAVGSASTRTEYRLNVNAVLAALALLVSAAILFAAFHR